MAAVRQDKVQVVLDVKAEQAQAQLDNLTRRANTLTNELKNMKRGTDDYIKTNKELTQVRSEIDQTREKLGITGMTYGQLTKYAKELNRELIGLTPGTETFIAKSKELTQVKARAEEVKNAMNGIEQELEKSGNGFLNLVKKSAVFTGVQLGIEGIVSSIRQIGSESLDSAAKTSDNLADIQKSTGLTKAEVIALNESFKDIDTRTTQEALQDIAAVGGQIGVAKDEIDEFTEATDKAVVALGDEFTGGAEEVAKKMGALQKLFSDTKDLNAGEAINKIGSAINALGADGTATGPVVADFTQRIGQLGDLAPEISQTLGLGAAFQELGLSAEISAGGLSNILLTAAKDTAGFSEQLGLTEAKFTDLINSNPNEVILQLADSLKGASNTEIIATLDGLGIKSQEATKVMTLLASKTDFVREKQALASVEMQKATSLTDEFNIKNNTLAAQIEKSEKEFAELKDELGQGLAPAYINILAIVGSFIDIIRGVPKFINDNKIALIALAVGVATFNKELIISNALALKDIAVKQVQAIWNSRLILATRSLNATMAANPIGAIITVVSLLVIGFMQLYERSQTVRAGIAGLWAGIKEFMSIAGDIALFLINPLKNASKLADIKNAGTRLGTAFSEGYNGKVAEEAKKNEQQDKQRKEKQIQDEVKHAENKAKILTAAQKKQLEQYRKLVDESRGNDSALDGKEVAKLQKAMASEQKKALAEKKKEREKEAKELKDLQAKQAQEEIEAARKIRDLEISLIQDETERKVQALTEQASREVLALKGTGEQITAQTILIQQKRDADIAAVRKDAQEKALKETEEAAKKEQDIQSKIALGRADINVATAKKSGNIGSMEAAEKARLDTQLKLELQNTKLTDDEKLLIHEQYEQRRNEISEQYAEVRNKSEREKYAFALEQMQVGIQSFSDFKKIASDKELLKVDKDKNERLKKLEQEYKAGRVSKEVYENQKSAIESNYDAKTRALKRKAAQDEKAANVAQSIISGALAVIKAAPNIPLQIATGITAALATAKIIATPIPTFEKGGMFRQIGRKLQSISSSAWRGVKTYANGGKINSTAGVANVGQYHSNKGIQMIDGSTGEHLGEWEKGEPYMILSRNTLANNGPLINKLLDSSLNRGGAKVHLAKGGIYADGGLTGSVDSSAAASSDYNALISEVKGLRNDVRSQQTLIKAYVVSTELRSELDLVGSIEEESGV